MVSGRPPDDRTRPPAERQTDAGADGQHHLAVAREQGDQGRKSGNGGAVLEHPAVQAVLDRDSTRADLEVRGGIKTKSGVKGGRVLVQSVSRNKK